MITLVVIGGIIILLLVIISKHSFKKEAHSENSTLPVFENFTLCSECSVKLAMLNIQKLIDNNDADMRYYKSYHSLNSPKEEIFKSFIFLKDVYHFCKEHTRIYQDKEFISNLGFLEVHMFNNYLDCPSEIIPFERRENLDFGRKFKERQEILNLEISNLQLITWRRKEHWLFWANSYGKDSPIGKLCYEKALELY